MTANQRPIGLVTGASSGIGAALCRRLRAASWTVLAHHGRHDGDLSTEPGVDALIERARDVVDTHGLRLLVHCAGDFTPDSRCGGDAAARMFSLHACALHRLVLGLRRQLAAAAGTVVLVSSSSAVKATPDQALYGSTKAAAESIVSTLGYQLGRDGIRVIGVRPSLVRTRMSASALADPAAARHFARQSPLGRIAEPDDIVGALLTLAAPPASWITGVTVWADGGTNLGWGDEHDD